jgi:hypothetical protein
MALKIKLTAGEDTFEVEGDFTFDPQFLSIVQAWSRAIGPAPEQSALDAIAAQSESQSDALDAAVQAHQPVRSSGD